MNPPRRLFLGGCLCCACAASDGDPPVRALDAGEIVDGTLADRSPTDAAPDGDAVGVVDAVRDDLAAIDAPRHDDAARDVAASEVAPMDVVPMDVAADARAEVAADGSADARVDVAPEAATDAGCDPRLPVGWPSRIASWSGNPVLVPSSGVDAQGRDNVYAPDLHRVGEAMAMWYGAQGRDGHDRIYVAVSHGAGFRKWPTDLSPAPVLDRGTSNHVNDPSVVRDGARWRMYYTDAATAEDDRIWLAESASLTGFSKVAEVLGVGPAGAWDSEKVGRPSVLLEGGVYRMWYDGTYRGSRHVGLATSTDGVHFTRHPANPLFLNAGAVDVKRIGGVYVMLREGGDGTYWATSPDGVCWIDRGRLFGLSGAPWDRYGQVTPFLEADGDVLRGVWFGGASVSTWDRNRIGVALPEGGALTTGGGCAGCLTAGQSCAAACQAAGAGRDGVCGAPGSADPGRCCACSDDGCGRCAGAADCHAACVTAGAASGWCATPGSTDPGRCCACAN